MFTWKVGVDSKGLKQFTRLIDNNLDVIQLQNKISMSAIAQITVYPILTSLSDINFTGGDGLITVDWFYSNYDFQKILLSDFSFSNFNIDKKSIINTQTLKNLLKKSNQADFVNQISLIVMLF